jgi:hypothetical protein
MKLQEAHKTGRKYHCGHSGVDAWYRLDDSCSVPLYQALADNWEVEPEVYEVECEMVDRNGYLSIGEISNIVGAKEYELYMRLVCKRVKATFEVLD